MALADKAVPRRADATLAVLLVGALITLCSAAALFIGFNAGSCHAAFAAQMLCVPTAGVALAIAVAALPLLLFIARHRPLAALFGLYIILVPIDDTLHLGQALSLTKLVGLAAAAVALAMMVGRRAQLRLPNAVFGWAALIALMALSMMWTIEPTSAAANLFTILSTFALLVIMVAAPTDEIDVRAMVVATIVSGVVVGVVAMFAAHNEISTLAGRVGRLFLNLGSTTEDPNRFGAALVLPVAMTVGAICQARGWRRIGLLAILPFPLAAIYLTGSRGTTLALLAMTIVPIIRSKHRIALIVLLAVGIGLLIVVPNEITYRFFASGTTASGAGRVDIWTVALAIFRGHWLVGTGVGSFPWAYDRTFFSGYEADFAGWNRAPHSLLVSTSTELGIVGMLFVISALVLQYRSLRLIGDGHPYSWLRPVFEAAFVGLLVASLFVDVLGTKFAWLLFTEMLIVVRLTASPIRHAPKMAA